LSRKISTNALVRSTFAVTKIQGGTKVCFWGNECKICHLFNYYRSLCQQDPKWTRTQSTIITTSVISKLLLPPWFWSMVLVQISTKLLSLSCKFDGGDRPTSRCFNKTNTGIFHSQDNVIPASATAHVNVRIHHGDTVDGVSER
jgi:hypothetical protein